MDCKFEVGQRVVCYDASFQNKNGTHIFPEENAVYTIRELYRFENNIGLRFVEIVNPPVSAFDGTHEPSFDYRNFRPVEEKKFDLSVFHALLEPAALLAFKFKETDVKKKVKA